MPTVAIPINMEIIDELVLRSGAPKAHVSGWIENIVRDYLEQTAYEGNWSEAYYSYCKRQAEMQSFISEFGTPEEGYLWSPIFLPNGTLVRVEFHEEISYATIKNSKLIFKGEPYLPDDMVGVATHDTSRNAWRHLLIKRPGDSGWSKAEDLKRKLRL